MDRVKRVTSILTYIASSKVPCRVTEISKELKITKSSASRILSSLKELNWVTQLETEEYTIGDNMVEISLAILSDMDIITASRAYLDELNDITLETIGLYLRLDNYDICVDQRVSMSPVRHVLRAGNRQPLWTGASGKVILANMDEQKIEEILSEVSKSEVPITASGQEINIDSLKNELDEIKRNGYAISLGERTAITAAIGAPIFEHNKVIGSIIVTGPLPRFDKDLAIKYSVPLVEAAKKISMRLGSNF